MVVKRMNTRREKGGGNDNENELKIHISRVPTRFDEAIVLRILTEQLLLPLSPESAAEAKAVDRHAKEQIATSKSSSSNRDDDEDEGITPPPLPSIQVELIYPRRDQEGTDEPKKKEDTEGVEIQDQDDDLDATFTAARENAEGTNEEHRGFGFITFQSKDLYEKALAMSTIKGGRKPNSIKLRTMHLRPYATQESEEVNQCYLWTNRRCPYGDNCKFTHAGPGACLSTNNAADGEDDDEAAKKKKRGKCFAYKKGKCSKGVDCPFSHDFEPAVDEKREQNDRTNIVNGVSLLEKVCINWKTKGKCRKGDKCPYRHDPEVLKKVEEKKNKRKREFCSADNNDGDLTEKKKNKQPLCIRVFGMAYDTTEEDIRTFFEDCGKIQDVRFPVFEDSGRSKGYCGVWFASPKAVDKAIELDGKELLGRWLSVQVGKMYLKEWEANHSNAIPSHDDSHAIDAY